MTQTVPGLTAVPTADLKQLLLAVHRELITTPFDIHCVTGAKLQHVAEPLLAQLRGLEPRAIRAVVTAVIAERLQS